MFWEVGVIKLTANRRQFSPISLNRGGKQAKLPDPLWDEGHYRIGFRRPSQDINNSENQALSSCLKKTSSTAQIKCKSAKIKIAVRWSCCGIGCVKERQYQKIDTAMRDGLLFSGV
jgi:hypothetical protein